MESRLTRLDYCQFLLSSQVNYTLTRFAGHSRRFSHEIEACKHLQGTPVKVADRCGTGSMTGIPVLDSKSDRWEAIPAPHSITLSQKYLP